MRRHLLLQPVSAREGRGALRRFGIGVLLYPGVTAAGLVSPVTMLLLYVLLTGYCIVEQTPILPTTGSPPKPRTYGSTTRCVDSPSITPEVKMQECPAWQQTNSQR